MEIKCPICFDYIHKNDRYPFRICNVCFEKTKDKDGNDIVFSNTSILGHGCIGYYKKTKKVYDSNLCYVNNIECEAEESYFGGITIQKRIKKKNKQYIKELVYLNSHLPDLDVYSGEDAEKFEKSIFIVEKILDGYGLPYTKDNCSLLNDINTIEKGYLVLSKLNESAHNYLIKSAQSNYRLLKSAIKNKSDVFEILPEIKVPTHIYTIYLYEVILFKNPKSIKEVLAEFQILLENEELLNTIGMLKMRSTNEIKDFEIPENFEKLKYVEEYLSKNEKGDNNG